MSNQKIRQLKATELKLLQERTKVQRRIDELLHTGAWKKSDIDELGEQQDRLEKELGEIRLELHRLERNEGTDDD